MFINQQSADCVKYYERMLATVGSLSKLFSDSDKPYLAYRVVEKLFCKSFNAEDLSRADTSIDATKQHIGVGIKTFLHKNGRSYEKIAEFNRELNLFKDLTDEAKVIKIAELRNERIAFTRRNYNLRDMIYHCVTRKPHNIAAYEYTMNSINIRRIKNIKTQQNSIRFEDENENYSFNVSKSTLFKQFLAGAPLLDTKVEILPEPFEVLGNMLKEPTIKLALVPIEEAEHIFLPLYSGSYKKKYVPEKSGLNQWNASGRPRDPNEIYIPIPIIIHQKYPGFLPDRDTSFNLSLPNKNVLSTKVCQDNSKALMSNPNSALGEWLLRDVFNLKERELLTYQRLEVLGIDSVVIYKVDQYNYTIDFTKIGAYDEFIGRDTEPIGDD